MDGLRESMDHGRILTGYLDFLGSVRRLSTNTIESYRRDLNSWQSFLREHNGNLLHVDDSRMWEEWLAMNSVKASFAQTQMMLEDRHFQLSSTINGLGVSLFASWLVQDELESGVLVNPFGRNFETSFAYHLIVPKGEEPSKPVSQFSNWLLDVRGKQAVASS